MNILFVCTGNISRSFLAEMLFKSEIAPLKSGDISISSAGLSANPGNPPDSEMVAYLSKMGIPIEKHEAKQVSKQDVDWADLIVVMEKDHANIIKEIWPQVKNKLELLGSFIIDGQHADDIIDPFGKSPYHYRLAQSQITLAVRNLIKTLHTGREPATKDKKPETQKESVNRSE